MSLGANANVSAMPPRSRSRSRSKSPARAPKAKASPSPKRRSSTSKGKLPATKSTSSTRTSRSRSPARKPTPKPKVQEEKELDQDTPRSKDGIPRHDVVLWKHPILTLSLFAAVVTEWVAESVHWIATHNNTRTIAIPFIVLWFALHFTELAVVQVVDAAVLFAGYWFTLGVLSSVGLGTGMHSGVLFLFPSIYQTVEFARECRDLPGITENRPAWLWGPHHGSWGGSGVGFARVERDCAPGLSDRPEVTFWPLYWHLFAVTFIWGAGTAAGEIPPYAISRAAALAGQEDDEFNELLEHHDDQNILYRAFEAMRLWMIDFLQRHGFIGVLAMASWPNMAFDLCGICCGHFLMPFWTFFLACLIGKGVFKAAIMQLVFFIHLFMVTTDDLRGYTDSWLKGSSLDNLCLYLGGNTSEVCSLKIVNALQTVKENMASGKHDHEGTVSVPKMLWNGLVTALIGFFVVSCINQFAQRRFTQQNKATN